MRIDELKILTPKRSKKQYGGWEGFFPYYAGYPLRFADELIRSARLAPKSVVFDPWNGSGTTTYAAADAGYYAIGYDLNPVMVAVARARSLPFTEADSLGPLLRRVTEEAFGGRSAVEDDALKSWFADETATEIRQLERGIRSLLVGEQTITTAGVRLEMLSSIAAAFYVALFSAVRQSARRFLTTNPTWIKKPRQDDRLALEAGLITGAFMGAVVSMAEALVLRRNQSAQVRPLAEANIQNLDSTKTAPADETVDLILSSPPYCTRIDYVSSTRLELAVMGSLVKDTENVLRRSMLGSPLAPTSEDTVDPEWGPACTDFLQRVREHPSKASSGYYYRTHLDYFRKLHAAIGRMVPSIKAGGAGVFVVQDSHYKNVHNPVAKIFAEMAESEGLTLQRQVDFELSRTMASRHPHAKTYRATSKATESVLCFLKPN